MNKYPKLKKSCLIQLHHQFRDGSTKICAQREIEDYNQMGVFLDETKASHPLPANAQWLACTIESKHFVMVPT